MNWLSLLSLALKLVGPAVKAVATIASESHTGATKRQMAVDAVLLGSGVADAVLSPSDQQKSDAIAKLVGHSIDATVEANKLSVVDQVAVDSVAILPDALQGIAIAAQSSPVAQAA